MKLAWWFCPDDGLTQFAHNGERVKVEPGQVLTCDPDRLKLCVYGLHASYRAIDALEYAPGSIVCRVKVGGKIIEDEDKVCAERREVVWMANADKLLHEFGCRCAERALKKAEVKDKRCWNAIKTKRRWLIGKATDDELDAAMDAAASAAWSAAMDAASAAWDVSRDAAMAAAYGAMYAASAAWSAARDAAWDATMAEQNKMLEAMLERLGGEG